MLLYPDVMKQAQSDIDAVVGPNRLPGFGDLDSLPYILAIIKELGRLDLFKYVCIQRLLRRSTFRWHPPAPLSLPHATSEDDIYEGMFIPAGSTVIANV
jgi:cytochrome P450